MLISALGKYDINELNSEDVVALDPNLARALNIKYIYELF